MNTFHVVKTQLKENYGCHDWDGEGECPQYWKFKGGNEYVLTNFPDEFEVFQYMNEFYVSINDLYYEYIVGVEKKTIGDSEVYITQDEQLQMDHDGKIHTYSKRIDYEDLLQRYGHFGNWRMARTRQAQEYYEKRKNT